jgi:hypothetical protein
MLFGNPAATRSLFPVDEQDQLRRAIEARLAAVPQQQPFAQGAERSFLESRAGYAPPVVPARFPGPVGPPGDDTLSGPGLPTPQRFPMDEQGLPGQPGGHVPDFASHYQMHGLNEHGERPKKHRSTGEKILRGVLTGLTAISAGQGNYGAQMALRERALNRQERRKSMAELVEHNRLVGSMLRQGMSPDEAEIAATNPEAFSSSFSTRFKSGEMTPGSTHVTRNLDGSERRYMAPRLMQHGADIQAIGGEDPGSGGMSLRTYAEQFADTQGERGSPEWKTAAQDYILRGNGATAYGFKDQLQDQRLAASTANNIRSTSTSRDNSIRSAQGRAPGGRPAVVSPNSVVGGIMAKLAANQPLTAGEQQIYAAYNSRGRSGGRSGRTAGGGASGNAPRAKNARGEILMWDGRQWVKAP